jgi:hypothetical protein
MKKDNELIAEFFGFTQKSYTPTSEKLWCDNKHGLPVGELKFDTSWDWLMPVVEKIELLQFEFSISSIIETKDDDRTLIWFHDCEIRDGVISITSVSNKKIESVYDCIVKFIKWYNQQPK